MYTWEKELRRGAEGTSRHRIDIHVMHGGKEGFGGHITTGVRHM